MPDKTLVPVTENVTTVEPRNEQPQAGQTEVVKEMFSATDVAKNDFYQHTGEDPNYVPNGYNDSVKPEGEAGTPLPVQKQEPEQVQQPSEEMITIAGKEYKTSEVPTHYENLVKDYHKKNGEHRQDRMGYQSTISELKSQLDVKDGLLKGYVKNLQSEEPEVVEETQATFSNEALESAMDDGKGVDYINKIVDDKLRSAENRAETSRLKSQRLAEKDLSRKSAIENVSKMQGKFDSFDENRDQFANWMEKMYGADDMGSQRIEEVAKDIDSLESKYKTFLRDTYDFSKEIQSAKSDGQAIAEVKAGLQPLGQTSNMDAVSPLVQAQPQRDSVDDMNDRIWGNRSSSGFVINRR